MAALHLCWNDLCEVRSLAVLQEVKDQGWGRKLMEACLSEAVTLGFSKIFILTYLQDYFQVFGFTEIDKKDLPTKIWADCVRCVNFPDCNETAMLLEL